MGHDPNTHKMKKGLLSRPKWTSIGFMLQVSLNVTFLKTDTDDIESKTNKTSSKRLSFLINFSDSSTCQMNCPWQVADIRGPCELKSYLVTFILVYIVSEHKGPENRKKSGYVQSTVTAFEYLSGLFMSMITSTDLSRFYFIAILIYSFC